MDRVNILEIARVPKNFVEKENRDFRTWGFWEEANTCSEAAS